MNSNLGLLVFLNFMLEIKSLINFGNNACDMLLKYPVASLPFSGCYVNPDVFSSVPEIVRRHGYTLKTHSSITDDGYTLTIFEVSKNVAKNVSIFIQHGFAQNSFAWVDKGKRSLAFYLANNGYRVFLGNTRGSTYSKKHKVFSVHNSAYWRYNLDTLVAKDMVTQLGYVYKVTGHKFHYIGHSMGTTLALMFASTFRDEANKWIESLTLLAPVTYLDGVNLMELLDAPFIKLTQILEHMRVIGLFVDEERNRKLQVALCKKLPLSCRASLDGLGGLTRNFLPSELLLFFSHSPCSASAFQVRHFMQISMSGRFQKYDYGVESNTKIYGNTQPPVYNLTNVKIPTSLFYGENDRLYTKSNLERMYKEIGSSRKYKYSVYSHGVSYNHVDFLYGAHLPRDLYNKVLAFIQNSTTMIISRRRETINKNNSGSKSVSMIITFASIQFFFIVAPKI